jgi:hypothetical protein
MRRKADRIAANSIVAFVVLFLAVCIFQFVGGMRLIARRAKYERTLTAMKAVDKSLTAAAKRASTYPQRLPAPVQDAWGNDLRYETDGTHYWLASAGADGKWEHASLRPCVKDAHNGYDSDAVARDGVIIHGRYEGVQLKRFQMTGSDPQPEF